MSTTAALTDPRAGIDPRKAPEAYRLACWQLWPAASDWPADGLTIYEAAAYKGLSWCSLRRACQTGRDGKAALAHQRFGTSYRFSRANLDRWGRVEGRAA